MMSRICVLAGDISPVDVLTHIPIICEDHQIPYIYVPSKEVPRRTVLTCKSHGPTPHNQDLGAAALSKRPTSCMLILPQPPKGPVDAEEQKEYTESYVEAEKKIVAAMPVF